MLYYGDYFYETCSKKAKNRNNLLGYCPLCRHPLKSQGSNVRCSSCHAHYDYKQGILRLYNPTHISNAVKKQKTHFNWYAHNTEQSYDAYEHTPFWTGVDSDTFTKWVSMVPSDALVLDVGCAQGRSSLPFIRCGIRVIGYDISNALIHTAQERSAPYRHTDRAPYFFVGDASSFPFSDASFDVVVLHGVLHHLPDPGHVCKEIARVLKTGGLFLGLENNKTPARFVFDVFQRLMPQWHEEAGEEPLVSTRMLTDWFTKTGMSLTVTTRVFVPPHAMNLLPHSLAHRILTATDVVCSRIPVIRSYGGLIEIIGIKNR